MVLCAEVCTDGPTGDWKVGSSSTMTKTVTSLGETSKPAFLSFLILLAGAAKVSLCDSAKLSQMEQGLSNTQLSSPISLSLHLAHLS